MQSLPYIKGRMNKGSGTGRGGTGCFFEGMTLKVACPLFLMPTHILFNIKKDRDGWYICPSQ